MYKKKHKPKLAKINLDKLSNLRYNALISKRIADKQLGVSQCLTITNLKQPHMKRIANN